MRTKILILGAGPSGLVLARRLLDFGFKDFLLLEKNSEVGGLCRSRIVDDAALDIGGGHFLDARNEVATSFLFKYLGENEWNFFEKNSAIKLDGRFLGHPLESHLWQMEVDDQIKYLKSIAQAGCNNGVDKPSEFVDWIKWKLGSKLAENYMLPYNEKMFGKNLDQLGTYWLHKLPNVSFEKILQSCLERRTLAGGPAHNKFYYPKEYGYGEVWNIIGGSLSSKIIHKVEITDVDLDEHYVLFNREKLHYDILITTVPWKCFEKFPRIPEKLKNLVRKLHNNSIVVRYSSETLSEDYHWTYHPDSQLDYHRKLLRNNFIPGSRGHWQEINSDRYLGSIVDENSFFNEFAYPLNTIDKPEVMSSINNITNRHSIFGLGRWGEHNHHNSDICVTNAIKLADSILKNV